MSRAGGGARPELAFVLCGALAREVHHALRERGLEADLFAMTDRHHMHPDRIVAAVDETLERISRRYRRVVVVYGDCGTGGRLDEVAARHGAVRLPGAHCYELLAGADFPKLLEEEPATYFLTDFLVRHWQTTVAAELDLERHPAMREAMFAGFRRLLWLRADPAPELAAKARRIAESLGLPLTTHRLQGGALAETLERAGLQGSAKSERLAQLRRPFHSRR